MIAEIKESREIVDQRLRSETCRLLEKQKKEEKLPITAYRVISLNEVIRREIVNYLTPSSQLC
jgi:hypothetical protein